MTRRLYHDEDYAHDYTNPPDSQIRWRKEREVRAQHCERFITREHDEEICGACYGPRWAHSEASLREKAS